MAADGAIKKMTSNLDYPPRCRDASGTWAVLSAGFAAGGAFGGVEALAVILDYPLPVEKLHLLGLAIAFYGLAGLTAVLMVAPAASVASKVIMRSITRTEPGAESLHGRFPLARQIVAHHALPASVCLSLVYLVNHFLLPGWRAPVSIAVNGVLALCFIAGFGVMVRRGRRFIPAALEFLAAPFLLVVAAISFVPMGRDDFTWPAKSGAGAAAHGKSTDRLPNILLIVLDTVRADALNQTAERLDPSAGRQPLMPRLKEFSEHGVTFTGAFANAPWTLPSHASMFTGLLPSEHGATMENPFLATGFPTLAELLEGAGYVTTGISSNRFVSGQTGLDRGFNRFKVVRAAGPHPWARFAGKFILPRLLRAESWPLVRLDPDKGAQEIESLVLRWLADMPADAPYFLFLNYMEAHYPYDPPDSHRTADMPAREFLYPRERDELHTVLELRGAVTHASCLPDYRLYLAEVRYLDEMVGRLLDRLEAGGRLSNTLVIITSDHGECFGEHGLTGHAIGMPDTLLHVPLVLRDLTTSGATTAPPQRFEAPVQLVDLFRTILAAAGLSPPEGTCRDAIDLRAAMPPGADRPLFAERYLPYPSPMPEALSILFRDNPLAIYDDRIRAVRRDGYKWVRHEKGAAALYQYRSDAEETHDVQASAPPAAQRCDTALEARYPGNRFPAAAAPLDADGLDRQRELLKSLGYVGDPAPARTER